VKRSNFKVRKNPDFIRLSVAKLRKFLSDNEWMLIGLAWMVTYIICWIGIDKQFLATGEVRSFWDLFYRPFQLFLFDDSMVVDGIIHSWELELARFLAPAVATYTAYTALISIFHEQVQMFRLRMMHRHVVVCGLGRKGLGLVQDFRNQGIPVVAIEPDDDNDNIAACRELKAIVITGDATDSDILRLARVHHADKVIAITGNDGTNVEIAVRTFQLIKDQGVHLNQPVKCYVQVADTKLRLLFDRHPVFTEISDPFEITVFNTYSNSARLLFERFPLDRTGISASDSTEVHLIILGFGQMGESVLLQAAKSGHFANRKKITFTVVDRMADKKSKIFRGHYPQINAVCSTRFINTDVEDPDFLDDISLWCNKENCFTTIIVTLDDDAQALSCALDLLLRLENTSIPIIVRMSEDTGLAVLLQNEAAASDWMASIHPFGMTGDICNSKMLMDEQLDNYARKIHENFVNQQLKNGRSTEDPGMYPWEKLNPDLKDSNRQQADHIAIKLRAIGIIILSDNGIESDFDGFTPDEVELLACMEHDRWVAERLLAGWMPGPKEAGRRFSPYLVDYTELPDHIREYDREAVRNIPALLAMAGKKMVRKSKG